MLDENLVRRLFILTAHVHLKISGNPADVEIVKYGDPPDNSRVHVVLSTDRGQLSGTVLSEKGHLVAYLDELRWNGQLAERFYRQHYLVL